MSSLKVPVGVTSATGYGVTLASVVAAALDYIGGDHTQPTKTTLYLGIVAGVSFLTTQIGRYVQAHAQVKAAPAVAAEHRAAANEERWAQTPDIVEVSEPEEPSWLHDGEQDIGAINSKGEAVYFDAPHDLADEPEDDGSDQVPEDERRDIHEVC